VIAVVGVGDCWIELATSNYFSYADLDAGALPLLLLEHFPRRSVRRFAVGNAISKTIQRVFPIPKEPKPR